MKLGQLKGVIELDPNKSYIFICNDDVTREEIEPIIEDMREYLGGGFKIFFIGGQFIKNLEEVEGDDWQLAPDTASPSGFKVVQR